MAGRGALRRSIFISCLCLLLVALAVVEVLGAYSLHQALIDKVDRLKTDSSRAQSRHMEEVLLRTERWAQDIVEENHALLARFANGESPADSELRMRIRRVLTFFMHANPSLSSIVLLSPEAKLSVGISMYAGQWKDFAANARLAGHVAEGEGVLYLAADTVPGWVLPQAEKNEDYVAMIKPVTGGGQRFAMLLFFNPARIDETIHDVLLFDGDNLLWNRTALDAQADVTGRIRALDARDTDGSAAWSDHQRVIWHTPDGSSRTYFQLYEGVHFSSTLKAFLQSQHPVNFAIIALAVLSMAVVSGRLLAPLTALTRQFDGVRGLADAVDVADAPADANVAGLGVADSGTGCLGAAGSGAAKSGAAGFLRRLSFQTQLRIYYLTHTLLPISVLSILLLSQMIGMMVDTSRSGWEDTVSATANSLSLYIKETSRLIGSIAQTDDVQNLLVGKGTPTLDAAALPLKSAFRFGLSYLNLYSAGYERVFTSQLMPYGDDNGRLPLDVYPGKHSSRVWRDGRQAWDGSFIQPMVQPVRYKETDSLKMTNDPLFYDVIGYLEGGIAEPTLLKLYQGLLLSDDVLAMIVDGGGIVRSFPSPSYITLPSGQILTHALPAGNDTQRLPDGNDTQRLPDGRWMIVRQLEMVNNWRLVTLIPERQLLAEYSQVLYLFLAVLCGLLLAVILVTLFFARRLVEPAYTLIGLMNIAQRGDLSVRYAAGGRNELAILGNAFNEMMGRLQVLVEENYENRLHQTQLEMRTAKMERQAQEAELLAFQAQINPHFLYNTFASITFMIRMNRQDEAAQMMDAVGRMFRSGLYRGQPVVSLQEELAHLQAYLEVQQMRYRDKLLAAVDIPASLYPYQIVKLTLQPLVENAIYHGLETKKTPGHLSVTGRLTEDGRCIRLIVEDDGVGMDEGQIATVQASLNATLSPGRHVGLHNVNNRLRLYFGPAFGLGIQSEAGRGTRVEMTLPAVRVASPAKEDDHA